MPQYLTLTEMPCSANMLGLVLNVVKIGIVLGLVARADAEFRVTSVFSDGMVLQKAPEQANIWGYGDTVDGVISAYVNDSLASIAWSRAMEDGSEGSQWSIRLPAYPAGGPYTIDIQSSDGNLTLNDVWFGDIWMCSGQSNMEFTLTEVYNTSATIEAASKMTNIRILEIERIVSNNSISEAGIFTPWQIAANDTATHKFSSLCLLYAMELSAHIGDRPLGMVHLSWGGTPVESWSSPDALAMCPPNNNYYGQWPHYRPKVLWYGMVEPILPMTVFGAIWYQGESNAGHSDEYKCSFPAMISDWRTKFNAASGNQTSDSFPFGFVQLAGFRNETQREGFADLRWKQTYDYGYVPNPSMENVFMAVAMDLPDFDSPSGPVHPRDKQDIAQRLALAGRAVAYGEDGLDFQGPFPTTISSVAGTLTIEYDNGNSILDVRSTDGFEVCCLAGASCETKDWQYVSIKVHDQTSVTLDTSVCLDADVSAVRYAWEETPCDFKQCTIYNQANDLPAPPFVQLIS